jgi:hypothetical protein
MWNQFHYSQNKLALYKAMALISGEQRKAPLFQKQRRFSIKNHFFTQNEAGIQLKAYVDKILQIGINYMKNKRAGHEAGRLL